MKSDIYSNFKRDESTVVNDSESQLSLEKPVEIFEFSQDLVSPSLWIPLSLLMAVLFTINNEMKSWISKYNNDAIILQTPGSFLVCLLLVFSYSIQSKFGLSSQKDNFETVNERFYFGWFYDMYHSKDGFKNYSGHQDEKTRYLLKKSRIWATVMVVALEIIVTLLFFKSFFHAREAGINSGIIS
jgi:hypothetical protein